MLLEELKDFSNQTSINGIGQIANDRAPVIKRIIWLVIFVGSLAYAGQQLASTIKGEITENIILIMGPLPKYSKICVFNLKLASKVCFKYEIETNDEILGLGLKVTTDRKSIFSK